MALTVVKTSFAGETWVVILLRISILSSRDALVLLARVAITTGLGVVTEQRWRLSSKGTGRVACGQYGI